MIGRTMTAVLERWNDMDAYVASEEVLPCCGSRRWAVEMVKRRPMANAVEVVAASDAVWRGLSESDWREAFASHPRIGESKAVGEATERSLAWSGREQSAAAAVDHESDRLLVEANRAYENRFGRTFIVFASGRSKREILGILTARMGNDAESELREAAEQQRLITELRLRRWMEEH